MSFLDPSHHRFVAKENKRKQKTGQMIGAEISEKHNITTDALSAQLSAPELCSQYMQSLVNTAKELLQPQKIFSLSVQDGRIVGAQEEDPPPPPPSRVETYAAQRKLYQLDAPASDKSTIEVAESLHAPASLREFLFAEHEAQELSRTYEEAIIPSHHPRNFRQVLPAEDSTPRKHASDATSPRDASSMLGSMLQFRNRALAHWRSGARALEAPGKNRVGARAVNACG